MCLSNEETQKLSCFKTANKRIGEKANEIKQTYDNLLPLEIRVRERSSCWSNLNIKIKFNDTKDKTPANTHSFIYTLKVCCTNIMEANEQKTNVAKLVHEKISATVYLTKWIHTKPHFCFLKNWKVSNILISLNQLEVIYFLWMTQIIRGND